MATFTVQEASFVDGSSLEDERARLNPSPSTSAVGNDAGLGRVRTGCSGPVADRPDRDDPAQGAASIALKPRGGKEVKRGARFETAVGVVW